MIVLVRLLLIAQPPGGWNEPIQVGQHWARRKPEKNE